MDELQKKRLEEKSLYDKLYKKGYGGSFHAKYALDKIKEMNIKSLCDVGCGQGQFPVWASDNGIHPVYGIDCSSDFKVANGKVQFFNSFAHELPLNDKSVEFVTSFDMLEHILPEDTERVLWEFERVATRGFFFSISYIESVIKVDGRNLHPNIHPKSWWKEKLSVFGKVSEYFARYIIVEFN